MIKALWVAAMMLTASCVANEASTSPLVDEEVMSTPSDIEAPVEPAATCEGKCERVGCEDGEVPGKGTCKPGVCCVRART